MINLVLLQQEYLATHAKNPAAGLISAALNNFGYFQKAYPGLNHQNLSLYPRWLTSIVTTQDNASLTLVIMGEFFDWVVTEAGPEFSIEWTPARQSYFPDLPPEEPTFDQAIKEFLTYLTYLEPGTIEPDNWQSAAQHLSILRNKAFFHLICYSNITTTIALELLRRPIDLWLMAVRSRYPMYYYLKPRDLTIVIRPRTLEFLLTYLKARSDQYRPLFVSHSPSANETGALSREAIWHEAKVIFEAIGKAHLSLKHIKPTKEPTHEKK